MSIATEHKSTVSVINTTDTTTTEQQVERSVYNFNAGPAALPSSVLLQSQKDLFNYRGTGMSVMEMSHRSAEFEDIIKQAEADIRSLLQVPNNYKILFMQGGGTAQFAAVPLNLLGNHQVVDYVVTGAWSKKAAQEAAKYTTVNIVATSEQKNGEFTHIPSRETWNLSPNRSAAYLYFCANETIHGVQFHDVPVVDSDVVLVADYSSCFMCGPLDVSKFGVIYAGAQKNIGPAGVTVVIVRDDLLSRALPSCPTILNYKITSDNKSLYNTPPCWSIYVTGLVFKWLQSKRGLQEMLKENQEKADMIYQVIDKYAPFYNCKIEKSSRSIMNLVFVMQNQNIEKLFCQEAKKINVIGLEGHRSVGGMRVSLYNAISKQVTQKLATFMDAFAQQHHSS